MDANVPPHGWRIVGVSVTGPDHVQRGTENQDAFGHRFTADGFVLAVADGAGSAARSALGARLAVTAAVDAAASVLDGDPAGRAEWPGSARRYAGAVLHTFDRQLAALGGEPGRKAYATTLLAVVARPPRFLYLSVGDCFLVVEHRDGGAHLVVAPEHEESRNATVFLTTEGRDAEVRTGVIDDAEITGVALCSDGLLEGTLAAERAPGGGQRLFAPADFTGYLRAYAEPGLRPGDLQDRLQSEAFAATSADDKTIVLAARA